MSHVDDGTLHAYLDGELSAAEAHRVDAHLAQCPACRERLDEERALIARAGELLALAAPPDRELPPFRAGDVKPAPRVWWRVRLPLAWAATVALALGIGRYVGESGRKLPAPAPSEEQEGEARRDEVARQAAPKAGSPDTRAAVEREGRGRVERRAEPPAPSAVATLAEKKQEQTGIPGRADTIAPAGNVRWAAKAAAVHDRGYLLKGSSLTGDSARLLLGRDPLAVPDLPIRGLYRGQMVGYSQLVIVEQALDSSIVIDVVNGNVSPMALRGVVVSGAEGAPPPRPDMPSPGADASLSRAGDSLAQVRDARQRVAAPAAMEKDNRAPAFFVEVRGPVPADSLAALKRRLRPLLR